MFQPFEHPLEDGVVDDDLALLFPDDVQSSELVSACQIAKDFFKDSGHELISIIFCTCHDTDVGMRVFRNMPDELAQLDRKLKSAEGSPVKREALRLMQPFDWFNLSPTRYSDLQSMKFLLELAKMKHGCILGVPIRLGDGLAIFSVGIHRMNCNPGTKRDVVLDVLQLAMAMIGRLRELDKLFETKRLSLLEAKSLLFAMQGYTHQQIAGFLNLSELAVDMLFRSAAQRLGASNHFQLVSKAIADGEISNIQLTDFDGARIEVR